MRGTQDFIDAVTVRIVSIGVLLKNFGIPDNNAQQVIEIVGDSPGESADRLHFLALTRLLFEPFAVGDVTVHDDQLFYLAVRVPDNACRGFQNSPTTIFVTHAVFDLLANAG